MVLKPHIKKPIIHQLVKTVTKESQIECGWKLNGKPKKSRVWRILRNSNRSWIRGFLGTIGVTTNLHVDVMGLKVGLEMVWSIGFWRVEYKSDSLVTINLEMDPLNLCHLNAGIVRKIELMLLRDWEVSISHTYRMSKMCAD